MCAGECFCAKTDIEPCHFHLCSYLQPTKLLNRHSCWAISRASRHPTPSVTPSATVYAQQAGSIHTRRALRVPRVCIAGRALRGAVDREPGIGGRCSAQAAQAAARKPGSGRGPRGTGLERKPPRGLAAGYRRGPQEIGWRLLPVNLGMGDSVRRQAQSSLPSHRAGTACPCQPEAQLHGIGARLAWAGLFFLSWPVLLCMFLFSEGQ